MAVGLRRRDRRPHRLEHRPQPRRRRPVRPRGVARRPDGRRAGRGRALAPRVVRLWGLTAELATHFAGVTLVPYTDADADPPRRGAGGASARGRRDRSSPKQRVPLPVTVATDGSAARGSIGWGWLASDGTHACASAKPSVRECGRGSLALLAELRAISAAIDALPSQQLMIRTDCGPALALIRGWIEGGDRLPDGYVATHHTATKKGGLLWMQEQVRREAHRSTSAGSAAHVGDSLNEGADSLAKLARRATEGTWGFTPDDVPTRAQSIADVFATDHRRPPPRPDRSTHKENP